MPVLYVLFFLGMLRVSSYAATLFFVLRCHIVLGAKTKAVISSSGPVVRHVFAGLQFSCHNCAYILDHH